VVPRCRNRATENRNGTRFGGACRVVCLRGGGVFLPRGLTSISGLQARVVSPWFPLSEESYPGKWSPCQGALDLRRKPGCPRKIAMRDHPSLPDVICDVVPRLFGMSRCTCRRYKNTARVLLRACPMLLTAVEAPTESTPVSAFSFCCNSSPSNRYTACAVKGRCLTRARLSWRKPNACLADGLVV
jgi:hypothetical protein